MLASGRRVTVAEVAARCGFGSPAYFSQAFRTHFGVRAADVRRSAAQPADSATPSDFRPVLIPALPGAPAEPQD
jgi:AraC-like DNA-binding protein